MNKTSQAPGAAAEAAAERKTNKYAPLTQSYLFVPGAAETSGAINKDLGRHTTQSTDHHRESAFFFQRLSMLIQRYNAVAVLGTAHYTAPEDEI